ncbi:PREDICTED: PHD finger protein At2g01810-like [Camelina sativa]|uniref:PHD finger protein At2g01810-like n=1 Tax=Camelina sativa TaxID=90675 RepID=A0ABM0TDY7_CAMSA|nr:PREDICTED: PHD finger protein At2g01810-like [Camelina sativa]
MGITVYDAACTATTKTPKFLLFNDYATTIPSPSPPPLLNLSETFRDNIRSFLRDNAEIEDYTIDGNTVSCILLASQASGVVFPLYILEELISDSSPNPLCDSCRCVGWGHHYVSKRRYHMIIPKRDEWTDPLTAKSLKLSSHLMHGLVHCNGFGHLLCINSDDDLSGDQVMDFWNRLCTTLHTRKISLDDTSKKGSMDLRLLHGVAYGRPWFGKWDYMFSNGSFGVRKDEYWRAILTLSSIEVDKIMEDFSGTSKGRVMKIIIGFYRGSTETPLVTLSDLLRFMLDFRSKAPIQRKTAMALIAMSVDPDSCPVLGADENTEVCTSPDQDSDDSGYESGLDDHNTTMAGIKPPAYESFDDLGRGEHSRWPGRRLNEAAQAVLKVFKEQNSTITRQALREAVRSSIGDTGLIDFLLKHIDKVLIGDQIVQRFNNPKSRMLQFSLRTINSRVLEQERKKKRKLKPQETSEWTSTTPGLSPYDDIFYLYQNLLLAYPDSDSYSEASQVILSCKSFVKEWAYQEQNPLTVSCQVLPNHEDLLRDFTRLLPPGELVVVPENATIRELKSAAEKALRDTYCIMDTFEVLEIRNMYLEKLHDDLSRESQGKTEFLVKGFGLDTGTELRYEGGFDDWTVACECGARDDDGERMVACDVCKVWQHTLCNSIEDDEAVPSVFLCNRCSADSSRSKKRNFSIR